MIWITSDHLLARLVRTRERQLQQHVQQMQGQSGRKASLARPANLVRRPERHGTTKIHLTLQSGAWMQILGHQERISGNLLVLSRCWRVRREQSLLATVLLGLRYRNHLQPERVWSTVRVHSRSGTRDEIHKSGSSLYENEMGKLYEPRHFYPPNARLRFAYQQELVHQSYRFETYSSPVRIFFLERNWMYSHSREV